eukprot:2696213-Pyramimonas_sp.AAC.1
MRGIADEGAREGNMHAPSDAGGGWGWRLRYVCVATGVFAFVTFSRACSQLSPRCIALFTRSVV